jgi:hypothetical protein
MNVNQHEKPDVRVSIVVELENSTTIAWEDIAQSLSGLEREIIANRAACRSNTVEVFFVHAGDASHSDTFASTLRSQFPGLFTHAVSHVQSLPNGRYYALKNAGIASATGDITILLDSDAVPFEGWLPLLLAPFTSPETVAAAGKTYLLHNDFVSKTVALIWTFPTDHPRDRSARKQNLYVNNCAFRSSWLKANPFRLNEGFKVDCTLLVDSLREQGHRIVCTDARCGHQPLRGWRFLVWRALVTGRDEDRKFVETRSASPLRRLRRAISLLYKNERRVLLRVFSLRRHVELPALLTPFSAVTGLAFYGLAFLSQAARAVGLMGYRTETLPSYAEHT